MQLTINGKPAEFQEIHTIADLISLRGLKPTLVAVEQNGSIVPKGEFELREVSDGDRLEIVHFVGGG